MWKQKRSCFIKFTTHHSRKHRQNLQHGELFFSCLMKAVKTLVEPGVEGENLLFLKALKVKETLICSGSFPCGWTKQRRHHSLALQTAFGSLLGLWYLVITSSRRQLLGILVWVLDQVTLICLGVVLYLKVGRIKTS